MAQPADTRMKPSLDPNVSLSFNSFPSFKIIVFIIALFPVKRQGKRKDFHLTGIIAGSAKTAQPYPAAPRIPTVLSM